MADLNAVYDIQCSSCSRRYTLTLKILGQKKKCAICGGALNIPPELQSELTQLKSTGVVRPKHPVAEECFVCSRDVWVKPDSYGKTIVCQYCTCPMAVAEDGAVSTVHNYATGELERSIVAAESCPSCRQKKLVSLPGAGLNVRCEACGQTADITAASLSRYFDLARPGNALMTDFAQMALQARWEKKDVTLSEAEAILGAVNRLDAWAAQSQRLFSPFDVQVTAEIVQYAIACNASAMSDPLDNGLLLVFPMREDTSEAQGLGQGNVTHAVAKGLMSIGRHRMPLTSLMSMGRRGSTGPNQKPEEQKGEQANCLAIVGDANGCNLEILFRDRGGNLGASPLEQEIRVPVESAMLNAARQYFAFKAVYGNWATGATLYGATARGLEKRLKKLGGVLADKAGEFSQALLPKAALNI
jgi:hypothetical protein